MDEPSEVLTLIQTGTSRRVPVILVGSAFWGGLINWLRGKLTGEEIIAPEDQNLIRLFDEAPLVVDAVFRSHEKPQFPLEDRERHTGTFL